MDQVLLRTRETSPLVLCGTVLLLAVVARVYYNLFLHPLAGFPGPILAAVSDLWKYRATAEKKFATRLRELHEKHGKIVRIATNEVSIVDCNEVNNLYGHKTEFLKGPFYNAWHGGGTPNHFSDRNPATHAARRRLAAAAYSVNYLKSLEAPVDENIELLLSTIVDNAVERGETVDISDWVTWFAWDTVGDLSFGSSYGLLADGGDKTGLIEEMSEGTGGVSNLACLHRWSWIAGNPWYQELIARLRPNRGTDAFRKRSIAVVQERLALRENDPAAFAERRDMLSKFMTTCNIQDPVAEFRHLMIESNVIVVAGADTTAISTNSILARLYTNPNCLSKLREEIDEAVSRGEMSLPPSYDQTLKLQYLQACIKESLRLHPAVGMPLQRVVPAGGRVVAGQFFPAGITVGMSAWQIHYDETFYGQDVKDFKPERWLGSPEERNKMDRNNLAFGQGSRVCIGKNISMMEMSKLITTFIYRYDLEVVNPDRPYRTIEHWFTPQTEFFARVTRRPESEA